MGTNAKWNVFVVFVASLVLTVSVGGLGPSPALACEYGWMTGGGSIFASNGDAVSYGGQGNADARVTHGFVVHCTPRHSDNLQIVDHSTNQIFHLTELTFASCWDAPEIEPNPPDAAFDAFYGEGYGRCKQPGQPPRECSVDFLFTDGGERGGCVRDTAFIQVRDVESGDVVIEIVGNVDCGNHQAHDGF